VQYAIPILALALLCAAWVVVQRWIAKRDPESPGIHRRCDGCPGDDHCEHRDGSCHTELTTERSA